MFFGFRILAGYDPDGFVASMGNPPKHPLRRSRRQEFAFAVTRSEQDHLREGLRLGRGGRGGRGGWKMLVV